MFKTIIKKEILEAMRSLRFLVAMLLCIVLIPLGMYVNLKEYEQRLNDYQELVQIYRQNSDGNVGWNFQAEGYRPPSAFSIFSVGLEYFLPNKIETSRDDFFRTSNELGINNPQSLLFGKVDLLFNVSFVISLLALLFTFNTITGEKEEATLRLIISNPVPRWQILLAKVVGNYIVLLIPFLISIIISMIILNVSGVIPILAERLLPSFIVILFITLLFILSMFNLGVLVSTLTHRSITSIVVLLFVWTVLVLSVPKISPMIAEIIHPVQSQQVMNLQKMFIRQNFEKELEHQTRQLYDRVLNGLGLDPKTFDFNKEDAASRNVLEQYREEKKKLEDDYQKRITLAIRKLEEEYNNRQSTYQKIAMNLSRISPVSCYTYIVSEISGTGVLEVKNVVDNAKRFQNEVKENLYDKFIVNVYGGTAPGRYARLIERVTEEDDAVPEWNYQQIALSKALEAEGVDILLLFIFNVVFFLASHISFLKYDIR
jgi:ABC-type transport system involved in multi-copper enzyme maturation permease subunit